MTGNQKVWMTYFGYIQPSGMFFFLEVIGFDLEREEQLPPKWDILSSVFCPLRD
jgi:hypothetical protein